MSGGDAGDPVGDAPQGVRPTDHMHTGDADHGHTHAGHSHHEPGHSHGHHPGFHVHAVDASFDPAAELRAHGLRATGPRLRLMEAMASRDHLTVEGLYRATEGSGIALTTVYRTLECLEEAALVWATHVPGVGRTYHLGATPPHAHLICRECGRLDDLRALPEQARTAIGVPEDFRVEHVQVTVVGRCGECGVVG